MRRGESGKGADAEASGGHDPVWTRSRRRSGGNPLIGLIVTLLALFGALTLGLAVREGSVARAGAVIDTWSASGWTTALRMVGKAPDPVERQTKDLQTL